MRAYLELLQDTRNDLDIRHKNTKKARVLPTCALLSFPYHSVEAHFRQEVRAGAAVAHGGPRPRQVPAAVASLIVTFAVLAARAASRARASAAAVVGLCVHMSRDRRQEVGDVRTRRK